MSLIVVPIDSYDNFRSTVLARAAQNDGYNVDNAYGFQCWDLAAELWMNIPEFSGGILYPQTGPNLAAEECWTVSRDVNAGMSFDLIWQFSDIKRGDCIVISSSPISTTGHIAFADQDYNGSNDMILLGQNQVDPSPLYGHIPTLTNVNVGSYFLGAFRYKAWEVNPPIYRRKSDFPWVVVTKKLRDMKR